MGGNISKLSHLSRVSDGLCLSFVIFICRNCLRRMICAVSVEKVYTDIISVFKKVPLFGLIAGWVILHTPVNHCLVEDPDLCSRITITFLGASFPYLNIIKTLKVLLCLYLIIEVLPAVTPLIISGIKLIFKLIKALLGMWRNESRLSRLERRVAELKKDIKL